MKAEKRVDLEAGVSQTSTISLDRPGAQRSQKPPKIRWFEPMLVVAAALIHAVVSSLQMSDHWLMNDYWAHLGEAGLPAGDLFRAHGGHWNFFNNLVANGLTDWFGPNYWPAFGVLRAVAWASLGLWAWWSTRRLGAEPIIAVAAAVLIITFGGAYWFKPWLLNIVIAHFVWVGASIIVGGEQSNRQRALLTGLLIVGVASGSQATLFTGAALLYCGWLRRMRFWLPSIVSALTVWVAWATLSGRGASGGSNIDWSVRTVLSMPWLMFELLANALARFADVQVEFAAIILLGIGAAFAYRVINKTVTSHEVLSALFIALLAAATVLGRVLPGISGTNAVRYVLFAIPMIFGLAPAIRFPERFRYRMASIGLVGLVLAFLVTQNLEQGRVGYQFDTARAVQSEQLASTVGYLIANDVPFRPRQLLRPVAPGAGLMIFSQLAFLVDDGWQPEPVEALIGRAHSLMVLSPGTAGEPTTRCLEISETTEISAEDFWIIGEPLDNVILTWVTETGRYEDELALTAAGRVHLERLQPAKNKLFIDPTPAGTSVCEG